MSINSGMFSSNTDLWETPKDFFEKLDAEFHFDLDVCAIPENAKCANYYSPDQERSKGYKCYNYHCKGRVGDSPLCGELGDAALSCQDRVVSTMTNADRIRAMSGEELSKLLWGTNWQIPEYRKCLEWLQQPAEEN